MSHVSLPFAAHPRALTLTQCSLLPTIRGLVAVAFAAALAITTDAGAQDTAAKVRRWEFLVASGKLLPTGTQRDVVTSANLTSAQLDVLLNPTVALTASLGWARSRDAASPDNAKLNVFMYDVGTELRTPFRSFGSHVLARSFAGGGVGARHYQSNARADDASSHLGGYVGAGTEFGTARARLRLEARDYLTRFTSLDGRGSARASNDVVVLAGLRIGRP